MFESEQQLQSTTDHSAVAELSSIPLSASQLQLQPSYPISICLAEEKEAKDWEREELSDSERAAKETFPESPSQPSGG